MPGIVDIQRLGATADRARVLCILVHGRNQSPEAMEAAVLRHLTTPDVAFALPRAGAKCWYHALAITPLTAETRAELGASLADLAALVQALRAEAPGLPLVLAGFSQGACLSLEYAFTGVDLPDAMVALTGCRVGVVGDDRPARLPHGLPVYLTAGREDPWIPLPAFAEVALELGLGGAALRMDVFPDRPHEVSAPEIAMLDGILADLAAGHPPSFGGTR
jgi:phospholipase/carboxylesterase